MSPTSLQSPEEAHENPIFKRIMNLQRKATDPACSKLRLNAAKAMADKLMAKHNIGIRNGNYLACLLLIDPKLNALRSRSTKIS